MNIPLKKLSKAVEVASTGALTKDTQDEGRKELKPTESMNAFRNENNRRNNMEQEIHTKSNMTDEQMKILTHDLGRINEALWDAYKNISSGLSTDAKDILSTCRYEMQCATEYADDCHCRKRRASEYWEDHDLSGLIYAAGGFAKFRKESLLEIKRLSDLLSNPSNFYIPEGKEEDCNMPDDETECKNGLMRLKACLVEARKMDELEKQKKAEWEKGSVNDKPF